MVTWIPSIYPLYVSIYTSTMDPMGYATERISTTQWWTWSLLLHRISSICTQQTSNSYHIVVNPMPQKPTIWGWFIPKKRVIWGLASCWVSHMNRKLPIYHIWLVVSTRGIPTPLKNHGVKVSWDLMRFPILMESHKIPWFQTTNQVSYLMSTQD